MQSIICEQYKILIQGGFYNNNFIFLYYMAELWIIKSQFWEEFD